MNKLNRTDPSMRESFATQTIALIAALALIGLPVSLVAWEHLASPNLWFDESLQVFLSLGLEYYADPNTPDGGWGKMLEYSRVFNGDPGGFTVLLRFWTALFGYSPVAVRSLPFLFFLLTPIMILLSARRSGTNSVIAVLAASIPLGFPMLLHYATEGRPYSMETCAVVFLFFLPCWLLDKPRGWMVVTAGCAAALLVTSHYSAFLFGAAACLVAVLPLHPLRTAVLRASRFAIPLIIAVAVCYLLMARYQFGFLITGGGQVRPVFQPFVLSGKDTTAQLALLRENFLEPGALPITVYLLAAPLFAWLGPRSLTRLRFLVGRTCVFAALSVTFLALASLAGKLPWAWPTRWAIGYQTLSACCLAMSLIALGTCLWQKTASWPRKALVITALGCFVAAWSVQLDRAVRSEHPYYETIASHLQALASSPKAKSLRFFVQINATATTRYLVEYGLLKDAFSYPKNFHFETQQEANGKIPISAKDYDIIVLTHSQFSHSYRARVIDGAAEIVGTPPPSCLLVINNMFGTPSAGTMTFFNTGLDANGKPQVDGGEDSHYRYAFTKPFKYKLPTYLPTDPPILRATAAVLASHTGWLGQDGNLSLSRWLSISGANPPAYAPPGYYQFRTSFTLTGFNLSTFRLTGRWATDNDATGIYLNGHPVSFQGTPLYGAWTPLTIGPSNYFKTDNTLDFIVLNALHQPNPVGLRVELTGTDAGLQPAGVFWVGAPAALLVGAAAALLVGGVAVLPFGFRRAQA